MGETRTPAFVGQGRQGVDHRLAALKLAEVTFHAPHRNQCLTIDAVALFDALQDVGVLADQRLTFAHAQRRQGAVEVFPHRAGKFRLTAVGTDDAGVQADIGEGAVEQVGADASGQRILAEMLPGHSAKVWVGWMSRFSPVGTTGGITAGAVATGRV